MTELLASKEYPEDYSDNVDPTFPEDEQDASLEALMAGQREWQHGDPQELHPLWEEQEKLEYGMMRSGANKFRDNVIVATERNQMSQIKPISNLMTKWVPGVAATLKDWVRAWSHTTGPRPKALPYLKDIDHHMAALVGLREILDRIGHASGSSENTVQNVAMEIGRTIEHECKLRAWEAGTKNERALWRGELKAMKRDKVTSAHRRRRLINRFNHHLKKEDAKDVGFEELQWENWTIDTLFRVGWEVMDAVVRYTSWFQIVADPHHIWGKRLNNKPQYVIVPADGLTDWLAKALDHAEINQPDFRPTVMPPRPWTSSRHGGYWTPYVKAPRLVRFKASQENQKDNAADEYDAMDMPLVYRAINALQDTPYAINKRVLEVFSKCWTELRWSGDHACLPEIEDRPFPPRTPRMDEHRKANLGKRKEERTKPDEATEKEIFDWKKKASPIYAFNAKRGSRSKACSTILRVAEQFAEYETIYFPHMLDFRGRIYPIPAYLHPQGNDLARGLLTYGTYGTYAPITEENGGIRWLAICLASNWGHDKIAYADRVQWVHDHEAMFRAIAADPYASSEWFHEADKPWQSLAAAFEWVEYLEARDRGEPFYCGLPGMVDGTCNGIQHLSAIIRDEVAGEYVNLVPGDKPKDIYKFVANDLQATLEQLEANGGEQGEMATWWLELCNRDLPRSLTKRQVMVLPYGGTRTSFYDYTFAWLDEKVPVTERLSPEEFSLRASRCSFLAGHMWDSVKRNVRAAERVMGYIQDCARQACIADQPVFWTVPSGFTVRHFYGELKAKQIRMRLDGQEVKLLVGERSAELSVKEQLQGIAPNFIHSLDASALVTCINHCLDAGIKSFSSVHDAYGTHMANMDELARLLRVAFVETHEHDVLGALRTACMEVVVSKMMASGAASDPLDAVEKAEKLMPEPMDVGHLDLNGVLESAYFFA